MELLFKQENVSFESIYVKTCGDRDKLRSLRNLGKSDFFTREVELLHLEKRIDLSIHSAKDLPENLQVGLVVLGLTRGLDPRDALVFSRDIDPKNLLIVGTSSVNREKNVTAMFPNAICVDIRGTIEERLEQMYSGKYDAVVIAEAAIIRLGLQDLKRVYLLGKTVPGQGQLAVVARIDDGEIRELFQRLELSFESSLSISK